VAQSVDRGIALLFHDRCTRRGKWSAARPGRTLPPGKTRYPFYRRLGGPQGRSGRVENLVPTGIRSRTVQPVVSSHRLSNYRLIKYGRRKSIQKYEASPSSFLVAVAGLSNRAFLFLTCNLRGVVTVFFTVSRTDKIIRIRHTRPAGGQFDMPVP